MTRYVIVTRDRRRHTVERCSSVASAADKIVRDKGFHVWTVLAQKGPETAPMRQLNKAERKQLERALYPSLFDE
jgi:hypothetical protein